jgi:hypothetical protein
MEKFGDRENTIQALKNLTKANGWLGKEGTQANRFREFSVFFNQLTGKH